MESVKQVALTCITHDPSGGLLPTIKELKEELLNLNYDQKYITISNVTPREIVKELEECNFHINIVEKSGVGNARRDSLGFVGNYDHDYYHYCDFDRLLTWITEYPEEHNAFIQNIVDVDYLIIGRTEAAFHTHPEEWQVTETVSNKIMSLQLGKEVDITAGSCVLSKRAIDYIIKHSKCRMTDGEWPMIINTFTDFNIDYVAVDGLKYVNKLNQDNIIDPIKSWSIRLELSYIISQSILELTKTS
ncbi:MULTISPECIES: hypothetical protein [Bacillus cereus group]|uniref:Glycosyltransferase n=1 Tax=Bacillus paramycoides TaxID=2026194 RepID=A0ABU6MXY0_9BACI|nr:MULTISPECIES: hypothetical protein [Bacillus cereus group]MED0973300.1 hypothetical protein [Bacillus paramycoides]MED0982235.1 hypothetical protein [Bacillus paramycoides]MED1090916.1 hypothetical protein [Bacillus paramycoides]MED1560135.1 hypothetical protein [Bacillus paramycoides]MED1567625.1 hypothetical protein [Bacillus paramycoides]